MLRRRRAMRRSWRGRIRGARVEDRRAVERSGQVARVDADENRADVGVALASFQGRVSGAQVLNNCGRIFVEIACTCLE